MRTNLSILESVCDPENLREAWKRVLSTGSRAGIDEMTLGEFDRDANRRLTALSSDLNDSSYTPEPALSFEMSKPGHPGETRPISIHCVRDRIAQEAVRRVLNPRLDRRFLDCSYGYRPGKGPQRAVGRVSHHLRVGKCTWAASADIDDFFGSMSHDRLLCGVRSTFDEEWLVRLIGLWIKVGTIDGYGRWHDVYSGVRQGAILSPLLANLYLDPLDRFLLDGGYTHVRYADDILLLGHERGAVEAALHAAEGFLADPLHLALNPNPSPINGIKEGFCFLGIRFHHQSRSIAPDKLSEIQNRIRGVLHGAARDPNHSIRRLSECVAGWRRYYGTLVEPAELQEVDAFLQGELTTFGARLLATAGPQGDSDLMRLLTPLEMILPRDGRGRAEWIAALVRGARASARSGARKPDGKQRVRQSRKIPKGAAAAGHGRSQASARPPVSRKTPKRLPSVDDAGRGRSTRDPASSEDMVVRRIRRRHIRRAASASHLALSTPGTFVGRSGGAAVVRAGGRTVNEIALQRLTSITLAEHGIALSSDLLAACCERGIPVTLLSTRGQVLGLVTAPGKAPGSRAHVQIEFARSGRPASALAAAFISGKITNQLNLMRYFLKYRRRTDPEFAALVATHIELVRRLRGDLRQVVAREDAEAAKPKLFNLEAQAARSYWGLVTRLLHQRIQFPGRVHPDAHDLVNAMLNYGYAILQARIHTAVLGTGLSPQLGVLHACRERETPLVFDLMEEFRAPVVDHAVLVMLARREPLQLEAAGRLSDDARRRLLLRLLQRVASVQRFRATEASFEQIFALQAASLAQHLDGATRYRPFIARW